MGVAKASPYKLIGRSMFSVDFDGVIANTNNVKSKWIRSHLDIDVPPTYCDRTSCVSRIGLSEYERMWVMMSDMRRI